MPPPQRLSEIPIVRDIYKRWIPSLGFLGAGLAAVGGLYEIKGLTIIGAIIAAFSTMASAVRQSEFRDKLIDANEKLTKNAEEVAALVTGGDSFAHVIAPKNLTSRMVLEHVGKYPLYELSVDIVDHKNVNAYDINSGRTSHVIGTVAPSRGRLFIWKGLSGPTESFSIFFSARNGYWEQVFRCNLIDKEWAYASRVTKQINNGDPIILYEKVDDEYPRNAAGMVEW